MLVTHNFLRNKGKFKVKIAEEIFAASLTA